VVNRFAQQPKPHSDRPAGAVSELSLTVNDDIKSRLTYSVLIPKLAADDMTAFIRVRHEDTVRNEARFAAAVAPLGLARLVHDHPDATAIDRDRVHAEVLEAPSPAVTDMMTT
jgi:hypothetical protein